MDGGGLARRPRRVTNWSSSDSPFSSSLPPPLPRSIFFRVGNLFGESLYDIHSRLKGYPILEPDMPPAARKNMIAAQIMSPQPKVRREGGSEGEREGEGA